LGAFQAFRETSLSTSAGSVLALATIGGLALIGGLAAACFTKVVGIAFLGEPRTKAAAEARAPGWRMVGPMLVLAAGCPLAAGAVGPLLAAVGPALAIVLDQPAEVIADSLAPALSPLNAVLMVGAVLIGLIVLLAALRMGLLRSREVRDTVTWDCGYAAPAARMQYTATSFVQPITDFFAPVLRVRKQFHEPSGLFPDQASASTHHEDVFLSGLFSRSYDGICWVLSKLNWLQHGRLNFYVLYIALTLVALLVWQFGL